jgi:hypothetical protein
MAGAVHPLPLGRTVAPRPWQRRRRHVPGRAAGEPRVGADGRKNIWMGGRHDRRRYTASRETTKARFSTCSCNGGAIKLWR